MPSSAFLVRSGAFVPAVVLVRYGRGRLGLGGGVAVEVVGEGLVVDGRDVLGVCVAERGAAIGCAAVSGSIAACVELDEGC